MCWNGSLTKWKRTHIFKGFLFSSRKFQFSALCVVLDRERYSMRGVGEREGVSMSVLRRESSLKRRKEKSEWRIKTTVRKEKRGRRETVLKHGKALNKTYISTESGTVRLVDRQLNVASLQDQANSRPSIFGPTRENGDHKNRKVSAAPKFLGQDIVFPRSNLPPRTFISPACSSAPGTEPAFSIVFIVGHFHRPFNTGSIPLGYYKG